MQRFVCCVRWYLQVLTMWEQQAQDSRRLFLLFLTDVHNLTAKLREEPCKKLLTSCDFLLTSPGQRVHFRLLNVVQLKTKKILFYPKVLFIIIIYSSFNLNIHLSLMFLFRVLWITNMAACLYLMTSSSAYCLLRQWPLD